MKNSGLNGVFVILTMALVYGMTAIGCDTGATGYYGNGGNENNNGNVRRTLSKIDITGATNLFIAPGSSVGRMARNDSENRLFKVTEDGFVQEVTFYDDEGNPVTVQQPPTSIIVLNDNFLIISFGWDNNFLVNSRTGYAYIFTNDLPNSEVRKDANGNLFFTSSPWGWGGPLRKLTITNVNNVSISTLSAPNDSVTEFGVDSYGNVAYQAIDSSNIKVLRYRRGSGGFELLPGIQNSAWVLFWQGFNGKLYYFNASNPGSLIKEISHPFSVNDFGNNDWAWGDFNPGMGWLGLLRIENKRRIIGFNQTGVVELYNEQTNNATAIPLSTFNMATVRLGAASDNYYFLAGISAGAPRNVLIRVNPLNNNFITLIDGGYDIFHMTVCPDEVVTFNALRMSDGAIVIGQVSSPGAVEILDATLTSEVTVLERIR